MAALLKIEVGEPTILLLCKVCHGQRHQTRFGSGLTLTPARQTKPTPKLTWYSIQGQGVTPTRSACGRLDAERGGQRALTVYTSPP